MGKTIVFLAETRNSPSLAEQAKLCVSEGDLVIYAGRLSFERMAEKLAKEGRALVSGDRLKIYDMTCLAVATRILVRMLSKTLKMGVTVEFCADGIVIEPGHGNPAQYIIESLDAHWRTIHGIKTHQYAKVGRKAMLKPEQFPAIQAMLNEPGATTTSVSETLGVARATLFNFMKRQMAAREGSN